MTDWIPVKQRLPEEVDERVLTYQENKKTGEFYIATYPCRPEKWVAWGITHWMPLPDPPKE